MPRIPLLTSAYLPVVDCFVALYHSPVAYVELYDHYVKQTFRNRCVIAADSGAQSLIIPTEKYEGAKCLMKDIRISEHGNWRHTHRQAFISAYRQSPFFDYYADEFLAFFEPGESSLTELNMALMRWACRELELDVELRFTDAYRAADELPDDVRDLRDAFHPKRASSFVCEIVSYYQVFDARHGFLPHMSIADLLFNMGREALLVLRRQAQTL